MAGEIQDIKIRYIIDSGDIDKAKKDVASLTASEKALEDELNNVNRAATQANKTIQTETEKSDKALNDHKKNFNSLTESVKNYGNSFKGVGAALAGYFAVSNLLNYANHVKDVTAEFQKLEAVLTNTLGSRSAAQKALLDIQEFASKTPFGVTELTQAFVKLANQGFKPTTDELRKLGDLASSTGKSFDQLAEAVIDAQTGEFERLKEFGIRARTNGDQIVFTFKGVQTQVKNTNEEIRNYILSLGDLEGVSGSMEGVSKTLGGQLSNLGDEFDQLANTLGSNVSPQISYFIGLIGQATKAVREFIESDFQKSQREYNEEANKMLKTFEGFTELQMVEKVKELEAAIEKLDDEFDDNASAILEAKNNLGLFGSALSSLGLSDEGKRIDIFTEANEKLSRQIRVNEIVVQQLTERINELNKAQQETVKTQEQLDKEFKIALDKLRLRILAEENALKESYLNREIAEEQYIDRREALQLDGLQRIKKLYEQYGKDTTEIEAKILDERLSDYEKDLNESIKAGNEKLKAEQAYFAKKKKEQEDAYNQEIEDSIKAGEAKLKAEQKYHQESLRAEREKEQKRQAIVQQSQQLISTIGNGFAQLARDNADAELDHLAEKKQQELELVGDNKAKQDAINKRYAAEERKVQMRQAQIDKDLAIFNIILSTAQSVAKAAPNPVLMALAAAIGGAQIGIVAARPIPKFNQGTKSVPGVDRGQDSILAMLRPGEGVMPVDRMNDYRPTFDAMFDRKISPEALNHYVLNYDYLGRSIDAKVPDNNGIISGLKAIERKLDNVKSFDVTFDKKGIRTFLKSASSETELLNNYLKV